MKLRDEWIIDCFIVHIIIIIIIILLIFSSPIRMHVRRHPST